MKISQTGIDLIKRFEGCKLSAYKCSAGKWTIGYGNTFYPNNTNVKQGDVITQQQAEQYLLTLLETFENGVNNIVKSNINQNQFDSLVSFAYNCGLANLQRSTLLKKINVNPNDLSISNEFMKWDKAIGKQLKGLTIRRQAESNLYFKK
jgi:lysozyme